MGLSRGSQGWRRAFLKLRPPFCRVPLAVVQRPGVLVQNNYAVYYFDVVSHCMQVAGVLAPYPGFDRTVLTFGKNPVASFLKNGTATKEASALRSGQPQISWS